MVNLLKNLRKKLLTENKFNRYVIYASGEILLVVIGILIALWINDWNEMNKNSRIEHKYLVAMLEDFETNLQISEDVINATEEILPHIIVLLEQSALPEHTISVDSLNTCFSKIHDMPSYSSTDRIYNNLIGSGELNLIKDDQLKTYLAEYYKTLYVLLLVQNTHELELVQSFQPYVIEHLDFQAVPSVSVDDFILPAAVEKDKILEALRTSEFRNTLTLKWTILTDLLNQDRYLQEIILDIVAQLKSLTHPAQQ